MGRATLRAGALRVRRCLDRGLLQAAALALGQSAPDAEAFVVGERVLEAVALDLAARADLLGLARRAALLRKERLGVGLRAQGAVCPTDLVCFAVLKRVQLAHNGSSSTLAPARHAPLSRRGTAADVLTLAVLRVRPRCSPPGERHGWNYSRVGDAESSEWLIFLRSRTLSTGCDATSRRTAHL